MFYAMGVFNYGRIVNEFVVTDSDVFFKSSLDSTGNLTIVGNTQTRDFIHITHLRVGGDHFCPW